MIRYRDSGAGGSEEGRYNMNNLTALKACTVIAALVVGTMIAVATTSRPVAAQAENNWTSCLTGTVGPVEETSNDSDSIRWNRPHYCDDCTETANDPQAHTVTLVLEDTYVPDCGVIGADYVSTLYLHFCSGMGSETVGTDLGEVKWYQGSTHLGTRDLTYFTATSAYSDITCSYGMSYPNKLIIQWGYDDESEETAAFGHAAEGFDVLVQCCNS